MGNSKPTSENCFANKFPEIAKQWHPTKNGNLTPEMVTYSSHKNIHWICKKLHEWESTINNRTNYHTGCPYCSNKKVSIDNCLATTNPKIAMEWHPTKNGELTPYDVTYGNTQKIWWKCSGGHSYPATICHRTAMKSGCPYCCGKKVSEKNCLVIKFPNIAKEWDYTLNGKLKPDDVSFGSHKKVHWICPYSHSYPAIIKSRTIGDKTGCPYCSGEKVCLDNCLATKNPKLAKEWDYAKNNGLMPTEITEHSGIDAYWICKNNHSHKARIADRSEGRRCPYCNGVLLKDDALCASQAEAIKYIEYKEKELIFKHNKVYHTKLGKCRYDFYFPKENKYVEITSFNKTWYSKKPGIYFKYLRKIIKKRRFVENILKAKFEFIKFVPTKEQKKKLKEWIK